MNEPTAIVEGDGFAAKSTLVERGVGIEVIPRGRVGQESTRLLEFIHSVLTDC